MRGRHWKWRKVIQIRHSLKAAIKTWSEAFNPDSRGSPFQSFTVAPDFSFLTPPVPQPSSARVLQVSGRSCCRPSPGGPSRGMAQGGGPGSSRHTRPGRRLGSGGWRDAVQTPFGTRSRTGCPDLGPSKLGELRPSLVLDAGKKKGDDRYDSQSRRTQPVYISDFYRMLT